MNYHKDLENIVAGETFNMMNKERQMLVLNGAKQYAEKQIRSAENIIETKQNEIKAKKRNIKEYEEGIEKAQEVIKEERKKIREVKEELEYLEELIKEKETKDGKQLRN